MKENGINHTSPNLTRKVSPQAITQRGLNRKKDIEDSETRRQHLLMRIPAVVIELKPDGTILMVNQAVQRATGYLPEELTGKNLTEVFFPDGLQYQIPDLYQRLHEGDVSHYELEIEARDGHHVILEFSSANDYGPDGKLEKITGIGIDITQRKRAEEQVRQSEHQLSQAQQIAHLGSWIWDIPSDTITWSEELYRIHGLSPNEFNHTFHGFLEQVIEEDRDVITESIRTAIEKNQPYTFEYHLRRPDGEVRTILARGEVVLDANGRPTRTIGTAQDLSDIKQAEAALRERDELIRAAVTGAPIILFMLNSQGVIQLAVGKGLQALSGEYNLVGRSVYDYAEQVPGFLAPFEQALRGTALTTETEVGGVTFEIHFEPIRDEKGEVTSVIGIATDITERKHTLETLRESEERIRLLVSTVQDYAIFTLDPEGYVTSWNAGAEKIKGYKAEEIIGQHFSRFYPKELKEAGGPQYSLQMAAEHGQYHTEGWRVRKDGTQFWASITITALRDPAGNLRGFSKVVRDNTDRKQAEEALHRQTNFVRLLQEVAVAANQAETTAEAMQFAIDRICEYAGWKIGHVYTRNRAQNDELVSLGIWHLDDPEAFEEYRQESERLHFSSKMGLPGRILETGQLEWVVDVTQDEEFVRSALAKDSQLKTGVAFPILVGKTAVGVLEFYTDEARQPDPELMEVMSHIGTQLGRVVERKQAEEALRNSEARFRSIFENAALGVELADLQGRPLAVNPALVEILGYTTAELSELVQEQPNHPANLLPPDRLLSQLQAGRYDVYRADKPFLRKDGHLGWGRLAISLIRDPLGEPQYAVAMIEDITERKQMENDLSELQRRLMESREAERLHLAQELHDGPVQDLYGLSYRLKALDFDLKSENLENLNDMGKTLQEVINTLRTICGELRPPTLAPFGLEKAIRSHAEKFQEEHPEIELHLKLQHDGQALSEQVRLALFRIYQQMLVNIVRHAQASQVMIHFSFDDQEAYLEVKDNGKGFVFPARWVELARQGHLGLVGAVERAEAIGGQLNIESAPGKGTTVRVRVPRDAGGERHKILANFRI